jgi:hypothetical protein
LDSVEHGERVERDLDAFIAREDEKRRATEGERRELEFWQVTERLNAARKRRDHRLAWYDYEMRLYRIHSGLASEHLARAERLENGQHHEEENNGHHGG